MKILMLGGTQFVGRHLAQAVLDAGHQLTIFHRGKTHRGLFPSAEEVLGDRDGGLSALGQRCFDWVIDTCGYVPRIVGQSVDAFAQRTPRYLFISTVSVYQDFSRPGSTEDASQAAIDDPQTEVIDGRTYGPLKALCERRILDQFAERALIPRPGIIAGPHDPTGRFPYWVDRARGEFPFIAPEAEQPLQLIDARDLADWLLRQIERDACGICNTAGPAGRETLGSMVAACQLGTGGTGPTREMTRAALQAAGVQPGEDLPLWLGSAEMWGLFQIDSSRAEARGLTHRSLADVARDTAPWLDLPTADRPRIAGMSRQREAQLLAQLLA